MAERSFEAMGKNLDSIMDFVQDNLDKCGCPPREQQQICMAVEELFVNIVNYAYPSDIGLAVIKVEAINEHELEIVLRDNGKPFDPLKREDPDVTLDPEERRIGGLGIYLVKKTMDEVTYHFDNNQNVLTLRKKI